MAKQISKLSVILGATTAPFAKAFAGAGGVVRGFSSSVQSAGASLLRFTGIGTAIAGAVAAIGGLGKGISLAAELEQNQVAFQTMLGSASAAADMLKNLQAFAASTPFEFPELADSAKKLTAFGVEAKDVMPALKSIGDIAAGIGAPVNELAELYGKAKTQGTLFAQDINQLTGRGIPIIQELAKQFGVAESEVKNLVSSGKVNFSHLEKAFQSLTGEGGKFAGLMEAQSKTLSGLWSTLTDNIGMTLAGLTQTIIDAFNIKGAMTSVINGITTVGAWMQAQLSTWAPFIVNVMSAIWGAIVYAWNAIYAAIAPIVSRVFEWVRSHWQRIFTTTVAYYLSVYNYISAVLSAAWEIVKMIAQGIAAAWTWAMGVLGIETGTAGATIEGTLDSVSGWVQWFMDGVTLALNVVAWSIQNFGSIIEWIATGATYQIVKFANQIVYFFSDVIPGVLTWFANNWRDIFTTIWNFYKSVFINMSTNLANFGKALWSFLKGDGFNFQWTGLLTGFESTVKELPKIAERHIGPLEASLGKATQKMGERLGTSLSDYLTEQERAAKATADGIGDWFSGMFEDPANKPPAIEPPKTPPVTTMEIEADTTPVETALEDVEKQARDTASALGLVVAGSAEALQLSAQASFSASTATVAPLAQATQSAVRNTGKDTTSAQSGQQSVVAVLQQILSQLRSNPTLELVS